MRKFFKWLRGDPFANARESVCNAMQDLSRRVAQAEYHRFLAEWHEEEAQAIDPNRQWWIFADHKQKAQDHTDDYGVEDRRVEEAKAKLAAAKVRLHKLQDPQA